MKLTATRAAHALRVARAFGETPQVYDENASEYRPLMRGEITRGERYLRRDEARRDANIRRASNLDAMHQVASASGLSCL